MQVYMMYDLSGQSTIYRSLPGKFRERLPASKLVTRKLNVERSNLKKLSELGVRKQYQIKILKNFAFLENLNNSDDIKRPWKNVKEFTKPQLKSV
jgi:hypothetical protein